MYDTALAALCGFAGSIQVGGHFVVQDGHRDVPEMLPEDMPSKVNRAMRAVGEMLCSKGVARFEVRRDFELYIVTTNPVDWLRKVR